MLFKTVLSRESEIKIEMRKASFGGDRSEAGRYAANIRWQRQRGESKSETKGSLPLILQPTWDEAEAKKTGRPWAPLLEENYPPELQKAIRENISAWTEYYEAEISGADKFKLADLNFKISKLEPIDPLLYQHLQSLKLSGDVLTASLFALSSKIWSEIQTNKSLITRKYDAERKIGSPFKPIEEYVNGKDMRVVVNVPPNVLSQILGDGRIKSQFETKTSKGILDTYARQTAETRMFGTHPEVSAKNRTIYGHVMNDGVDDSILKVAIHYGRVAIVLKKDVAERTTFTVGDSLMHGSTPSRISEPKDSSFIDSDAMYVEAQIHGQVKLSDIAYIVTGPDFISSGLQAKAQRLGIPVVLQDLTGGGTIPRPKFKIEETGDMTKTVGHLIAVRGDGHKLFHTHTETQPLSNMVMRLGFLEDENGERLDVNVDSALRYGYWEEPNSLADLIKASFGGDRSEAGRYAANVRWQGHAKKDISQKVTIGFKSRGAEGGTVWATDKETGRVIGALSFDGYFISKVYVRPEHQRKGVASYLYKEAKKRNGGVEMRADDYTVSGAGFMSAMTGRDVFQSGDYSSAGRLWETWLNELEKETIEKASFGGDRSEAGRYAANIRWQNNAKDKGTGFVSPTKMKETLLMDGLGRNMLKDDIKILEKLDSNADPVAENSESRRADLEAKLAKREVVRGIVAGMQDIKLEEVLDALNKLGSFYSTLDWRKQWQMHSDPKTRESSRQAMLKEFAQHFVDQWANTSNDHETDSLMVQEVVKRVFNLEDSAPVDAMKDYSQIKEVEQEAIKKLNDNPPLEKTLTALVKAQYANTQAYLASKGITEVVIYRGMNHPRLAEDLKDYRLNHFYRMEERGEIVLEERDGVSADDRNSDITGNISEEEFDKIVPEGVVKVSMKMRPLSSFSLERSVANGFRTNDGSQGSKDEGVFLATRVPVARIFATPLTGVGCLNESEFVILGGELDAKASRSSAGDEDFDYDNMFPSRKEEVKSYG